MSVGPIHAEREHGFGVVEIIVSMFLLTVMALALLPLITQALQASIANSTLATATQLVVREMEDMRSLGSQCAALATAAAAHRAVFDPAGQPLKSAIDPIVCPAASALPATVSVHVSVTDVRADRLVAEATTLVLVTG
ncbi:hypothetical protein [Cryobacterium sp. PH31-L1]|uniref:type IV pilus modification PilV family protein n=1 Tax=Cryobacterium sp. PH31-L1 TaxID=3046199 RepID=UPI0024BA008F|nr:hypothetical protein [Cryobacterium sp. PH31-L1]MDJ0375995.1 hypothetical protein [Cryobacterium sp. PH31-L1]